MTRFFLASLGAILLLTGGCGEPGGRNSSLNRFTISLAVYKQDDRQQQSQQLQQRTSQALHREDVWIETIPSGLSVNIGHYPTQAKANRDLAKIKEVYSSLQPGLYQFFFTKEVPEPSPPAPPEWDIANSNCFYSLEIATYYNVPESKYFNRKKDAIQAVKTLRESGSPAYYYHGYHESRVLIGCISANAALPFVEVLRQKHPWHYENSYNVYHITKDSKNAKVRVQNKSFIVRITDIIED